jgi:LmbE family N-acetylglucosaminyl deacetylase
MEGLLVVALFWEQIIEAQSSPHVRPAPTAVISQEIVEKNPNYFSEPKTKNEKNRDFFMSLSFKKNSAPSQKPEATLIFAPHPDDEILCCSNLISEKIKNKENVKIIFTTNGDGLENSNYEKAREYGRLRKDESKKASFYLGLEKSDLFFLNFPDGQLHQLDIVEQVRSKFTDQNKSLGGQAFPYSPYTRQRLKQNFGELLKRWNATEVYIPSLQDNHADHRVTAQLVREVLNERELAPQIHTYRVHGMALKPNGHTVNEQKLKLIRLFKSQFWTPAHTQFMEQFAKMEEIFE